MDSTQRVNLRTVQMQIRIGNGAFSKELKLLKRPSVDVTLACEVPPQAVRREMIKLTLLGTFSTVFQGPFAWIS